MLSASVPGLLGSASSTEEFIKASFPAAKSCKNSKIKKG